MPPRRSGRMLSAGISCEPLEYPRRMWAAACEDGVRLTVTSAYRGYDTQANTICE
ncbi:MAG: M15 family metallopeptidase [Firmicutes bacterium]|nr:M15 family metallopeptidase [Bacillota bacterium]